MRGGKEKDAAATLVGRRRSKAGFESVQSGCSLSSAAPPVLVVGSGLHAYLGHPTHGWESTFAAALASPGSERGLPSEALALAWEATVLADSAGSLRPAAIRSEKLKLREFAAALDRLYQPGAAAEFAHRLRDANVADLVVLNFDRSLNPGAKRAKWSDPRRAPDLGRTRIWHPHGHTAKPNDIVFGTRAYGIEIARLEAQRERYWAAQRALSRHDLDPTPDHWLHTFLSRRDLRLIGLGLRPEEWTIWWALTQRARRLARTSPSTRPRTVAYLFRDKAKPEPHRKWRSEALSALGIEERSFGAARSSRVWREVIDASRQHEDPTVSGTETRPSSKQVHHTGGRSS